MTDSQQFAARKRKKPRRVSNTLTIPFVNRLPSNAKHTLLPLPITIRYHSMHDALGGIAEYSYYAVPYYLNISRAVTTLII